MKNTKVLEMLNDGKIEELKALLQDEIFAEGLKGNGNAKKRYSAMKKYGTENFEFKVLEGIISEKLAESSNDIAEDVLAEM